MTSRERIIRQSRFEPVDRIPLLGGWMNGAAHLQSLAGMAPDEFWRDPWAGTLRAYQCLGVDGLVGHIVPQSQTSIRQGHILERDRGHHTPEEVFAWAEARPSDADVLARFDAATYYHNQCAAMRDAQRRYGDIVWLPARWDCCPTFGWYGTFGYRAFFESVALWPDVWERVFRASAVAARARNAVLARVYRELDHPALILCGDDICDNRGPMVSPDFLRQYYWKWLRYALEPLHEGAVKTICHCDGNVLPIMDDILASGFAGLHGFQEELGPHLSDLARRRSVRGEPLLFYAGMSVSRTLPFGTEDDVRADIEYAMDATDGGRGLFLFPANVINPEAPIENVRAAYDHARTYSLQYSTPRHRRKTTWPWALRTGTA